MTRFVLKYVVQPGMVYCVLEWKETIQLSRAVTIDGACQSRERWRTNWYEALTNVIRAAV